MFPYCVLVFPVLLIGVSASHELCGQYEVFTSEPYVFNNDAWNKDDSGSVCTYVSQEPSTSSNSWYSLWQWTSNPPTVRAYPHVELHSTALPLQIRYLQYLRVSASWSFAPTSLAPRASTDPSSDPDAGAPFANDVQANVVIDVFGDGDARRSQTPAKQKYEIMIWLARFGNASQPIGMSNPDIDPPVVAVVDGTEFTLYKGTNSNGQQVMSWVANKTLTSFDSDFAPLLGSLVAQDLVPDDLYLGTIQFGTETFFASNEMNFSVSAYEAEARNISEAATPTASMPTATLLPQPTQSSGASDSGGMRAQLTLAGFVLFLGVCS